MIVLPEDIALVIDYEESRLNVDFRYFLSFDIDKGDENLVGNTEFQWNGPIRSLEDIRKMEAIIGEDLGGTVTIRTWRKFED